MLLAYLKKHMLVIGMLLLLLVAGGVCFYTVRNYHGIAAIPQTRVEARESQPAERSQLEMPNRAPGGRGLRWPVRVPSTLLG